MASVKTGVGRARARAGHVMESAREADRRRRAFTLIFATTGWSQKRARGM